MRVTRSSPDRHHRRPTRGIAACLAVLSSCLWSVSAPAQPAPKPWDAILVASFNIQVFGESKLSKPNVVEVLARVVRKFDVVAIQEVRAKSDDVVPRFVQAVNADGSRYHYVMAPARAAPPARSSTRSSTTRRGSRSIRLRWV